MPSLWRDWRLYLLILGALLLGCLAYQVSLPASVDIGALGDRAYLWASPLGADTGFNGDEHLAAEQVNYRWTKRVSWVHLPDVGWDGPLRVSLRVRGWRPEGQPLPSVEARVNGVLAGHFQATGEWEVHTFDFPQFPGSGPDLEILVETTPFTPEGEDRRTLGVQWDWVRVEPRAGGPFLARPVWRQLLLWGSAVALAYAALRRWFGRPAFWAGLALGVLVSAGLALRRHWLAPFVTWALVAGGVLCLLAYLGPIIGYLHRLSLRARSLPFFAALVGAGLVVFLDYIRWAVRTVPRIAPRPDAVLVVIFVAAAVAYAALVLDQPLRRLLANLDARLRRPWLAGILLAWLLLAVTLFEFAFIRRMHFIGHADYADNAVVARNLLAGRGFSVDYVTQFYRNYPGISHPQETWPLMQPVLIAPFFGLLGDSAFAAKLPNLLLQLALAVVLYVFSTRWFDRRVALVAVALTVFNRFIFRLIIFPTSDLAFTLFALLTLGQFFWASEKEREGSFRLGSYVWAGVWAGLMMLAKPNGALFVALCLLWDLVWRWRRHGWRGWWRAWLAFGIPAALLFAPWIGRNLFLFGQPIHSTEQFDAWILKYQDWEEIYRPYFNDLPNRSWLLRYGFDRVFQAIGTEFHRWWNYFSRDGSALLTLLGSALALGGVLALRKKAARIFSLVGGTFLLFGTFICTYWHVEERYFVPFIPWLALLAASGLWWVHDALAYRRGEEGKPVPASFAWLGLLVVMLACLHLMAPFSQEAAGKWAMDLEKRQELRAYTWLAEHTQPDEVVMTRVPWQLTYYTGRRTVMIPQGELEDARRIAEMYQVHYLLWDGNARGDRPALEQALLDGRWEAVYDEGEVQIYRFPEER